MGINLKQGTDQQAAEAPQPFPGGNTGETAAPAQAPAPISLGTAPAAPAAATPAPAGAPAGGIKLAPPPMAATPAAPRTSGVPAWMQRGADAQALLRAEEERREREKKELFRFWLENGANAQITFLDGDLDSEGNLICPIWQEHSVMYRGKRRQYPCVAAFEPCPLCHHAERPYVIAALAICNHTPYVSQRTGKVYEHRLQLFPMTMKTHGHLTMIARQQGGLAGCTFWVSRSGEKEPRVGNIFMPQQKNPIEAIQASFGAHLVVPNYEEAVPRFTAGELVAMNVCPPIPKVGGAATPRVPSDVGSEL